MTLAVLAGDAPELPFGVVADAPLLPVDPPPFPPLLPFPLLPLLLTLLPGLLVLSFEVPPFGAVATAGQLPAPPVMCLPVFRSVHLLSAHHVARSEGRRGYQSTALRKTCARGHLPVIKSPRSPEVLLIGYLHSAHRFPALKTFPLHTPGVFATPKKRLQLLLQSAAEGLPPVGVHLLTKMSRITSRLGHTSRSKRLSLTTEADHRDLAQALGSLTKLELDNR